MSAPYRTVAQQRRDETAWQALVSGAANLAASPIPEADLAAYWRRGDAAAGITRAAEAPWPNRCRFCGDVADTPDPSAETEMVCASCAGHGPCAQDRDDY